MRSKHVWWVIGLMALAGVVWAAISALPVQADISPPNPPSGANPEPGGLTNVRMVSETVVIIVDADSPSDIGVAAVTATFLMRNLGEVEERMRVRFPLDLSYSHGNICDRPTLEYAPIMNLSAFVNGRQVATEQEFQSTEIMADPPITVTRPCWEHFEVAFPVYQDVVVQVTYTAQPYSTGYNYAYDYILLTGAGWAGTIGRADIELRVPYAIDAVNFIGCRPDCTIQDNGVTWQFEDFEPNNNVTAWLLPPPLWQRILVELGRVAANPNDGEAWGRLGKAYKDSIRGKRGWRSDQAATELFRLSDEAYQRALALLPTDSDWQFGYADLLCWSAEWNAFLATPAQALEDCAAQLQRTLSLNPDHEAALALQQHLDAHGVLRFEGNQVIYMRLTQEAQIQTAAASQVLQPSATNMPARTPTLRPTAAAMQATATPLTLPSSTVFAQVAAVSTPIANDESENQASNPLAFWLLLAAMGIGGLAVWAWRSKRSASE